MSDFKRVGGLKLRVKKPDGKGYNTENFGVGLSTPWEGNLSLILELDTDEVTEEGYKKRDKVVAIKTASGRKIDLTEAFINFVAWEDIVKRPPRQD